VNDVYRSSEFEELHTLQRRLGASRAPEEHPYQAVFAGLSSLRTEPRPRRLRLVPRLRPARA
jgi:hypothetical protein